MVVLAGRCGVKSLVSGYILMVKSAGFDGTLWSLQERITKDDTEMFSLGNRKHGVAIN